MNGHDHPAEYHPDDPEEDARRREEWATYLDERERLLHEAWDAEGRCYDCGNPDARLCHVTDAGFRLDPPRNLCDECAYPIGSFESVVAHSGAEP